MTSHLPNSRTSPPANRILPLTPQRVWDPALMMGPAFRSVSAAAEKFAGHNDFPSVTDIQANLGGFFLFGSVPIHFVCQPPIPRRRRGPRPANMQRLVRPEDSYNGRIVTTGEVSTRPSSYHDFFNALVWATFPRSKWCLALRQYEAASRVWGQGVERIPNARTGEQDRLAMLDEGGLLLLTTLPDVVHQLLCDVSDQPKVGQLRELQRRQKLAVLTFGHALLEHCVSSDNEVRARPWLLACDVTLGDVPTSLQSQTALADTLLANQLAEPARVEETVLQQATPLGVVGLPLRQIHQR